MVRAVPSRCQPALDQQPQVNDLTDLPERVLAVEVHLFPAHRADPLEPVGQFDIRLVLRLLQEFREEGGVVLLGGGNPGIADLHAIFSYLLLPLISR